MTALAGGISRMMRPMPPQNYPRGGFSLEGKVLVSVVTTEQSEHGSIHKVDSL